MEESADESNLALLTPAPADVLPPRDADVQGQPFEKRQHNPRSPKSYGSRPVKRGKHESYSYEVSTKLSSLGFSEATIKKLSDTAKLMSVCGISDQQLAEEFGVPQDIVAQWVYEINDPRKWQKLIGRISFTRALQALKAMGPEKLAEATAGSLSKVFRDCVEVGRLVGGQSTENVAMKIEQIKETDKELELLGKQLERKGIKLEELDKHGGRLS